MPPTPAEGQPTSLGAPITAGALSHDQAEELARLLRVIADPVRLRLLSLIASHPEGQVCVQDLSAAFDLTGPTISHHLKVLRTTGFVGCTRTGTRMHHWVVPAALARLSAALAPGHEQSTR